MRTFKFVCAALLLTAFAAPSFAGILRERHCYHCFHGRCVKRDCVVTGPEKSKSKSKNKEVAPAAAPGKPAPTAPASKTGCVDNNCT